MRKLIYAGPALAAMSLLAALTIHPALAVPAPPPAVPEPSPAIAIVVGAAALAGALYLKHRVDTRRAAARRDA